MTVEDVASDEDMAQNEDVVRPSIRTPTIGHGSSAAAQHVETVAVRLPFTVTRFGDFLRASMPSNRCLATLVWLASIWFGWHQSGLAGINLVWLASIWFGWHPSGLAGINLVWLVSI